MKSWFANILFGLRDLMFEKAQDNLRRIASRKRAQRNHPKAKHSHARENARRVRQMWWDWYPGEAGRPMNQTHSGTIVLDAGTRNVYQGA